MPNTSSETRSGLGSGEQYPDSLNYINIVNQQLVLQGTIAALNAEIARHLAAEALLGITLDQIEGATNIDNSTSLGIMTIAVTLAV